MAAQMKLACIVLCGALLFAPRLAAYSVLSHEELIDISWDSEIRPALLKRFPSASPQEIAEAHAYAYGGSQSPETQCSVRVHPNVYRFFCLIRSCHDASILSPAA